ncbi:MAG: hypothetical protein ACSLFI_08115 [Solirubrobacterales bacterium]
MGLFGKKNERWKYEADSVSLVSLSDGQKFHVFGSATQLTELFAEHGFIRCLGAIWYPERSNSYREEDFHEVQLNAIHVTSIEAGHFHVIRPADPRDDHYAAS